MGGALWTRPKARLGLVAGVAGMAAGGRRGWRGRDCALVFEAWPWGPGGAMTLGNVILLKGPSLDAVCCTYEHRAGRCLHPPVRLGDHERAHVYQYAVLGPLFLPLYFLCGGIGVDNPFERAADRYAMSGRGWWPWKFGR